MDFVADLHLHSKYSRAVSQNMILPVMADYAVQKGINILTASDWTHPLWFKEMKMQLEEAEEGMYRLKSKKGADRKKEPLFLLSTEISSIYKQGEKLRRIHNLIFAPNFETAEKINNELLQRGCNLSSDGRPIVGLSSKALLELILSLDENCMLIPCHIWTPHFGIYGSASGFDSLEEAFGDLSEYIYGIETGLSSDPEMNWEITELQNRSILSFSDAHSPAKMGREATIFVEDKNGISNKQYPIANVSYEDIRNAIMRKKEGKLKIGYTIEFYPEEGKYHYSGHRNCKFVRDAEQIRREGNICPVCNKKLTEGVLFRVQQLADQNLLDRLSEKQNAYGLKWYIDKKKAQPPYVKLVPLLEIVAESMDSTVSSQKVKAAFADVCETFGSEIAVLLKTPIADIEKHAGPKLADGIQRVRTGTIAIDAGYDGEYGKVAIWKEEKQAEKGSKGAESSGENQSQLGLDI